MAVSAAELWRSYDRFYLSSGRRPPPFICGGGRSARVMMQTFWFMEVAPFPLHIDPFPYPHPSLSRLSSFTVCLAHP